MALELVLEDALAQQSRRRRAAGRSRRSSSSSSSYSALELLAVEALQGPSGAYREWPGPGYRRRARSGPSGSPWRRRSCVRMMWMTSSMLSCATSRPCSRWARARWAFAQVVLAFGAMMSSSWKARYSSMMWRRERILGCVWLVDEGQHVDGEAGLQLGLGEQAVQAPPGGWRRA